MSYLYIDSTYDLTLGILDDGLNWLAFENNKGLKASAIIQDRVYNLLKQHNLDFTELKAVITANGPGFYTGLRLAEGFADVFKFFGVPHFSFYSYEIPLWCGVEEGIWFTKAYRGEYFLYRWDKKNKCSELLDGKKIAHHLDRNNPIYIHSEVSLDELSSKLIPSHISTTALVHAHPNKIFKFILDAKLNRESFYFRAPEDEFKVNP